MFAKTLSPADRASTADIMIYKSMGVAIADLAISESLYRRALALGSGLRVELGGVRSDDL